MTNTNITEEMIDKCAHAYAAADGYDWVDVSQLWQGRYRRQAAAGLGAALAGYTVIEPATTNVDADCTVTATVDLELWGKGDGRPQLAAYDTGDGPVVDLGPVYFEIRHARSVAAAIVAVADRLASESSGETHG